MWAKIGKALKTHAEAIRTAIERYNEAATQLNPPREKLTWANVTAIADLAEFDLLKDMCENLQRKPWAKPAVREAIRHHLKVKHANEEIKRLNVEIVRLITYMWDQYQDYQQAVKGTEDIAFARELHS